MHDISVTMRDNSVTTKVTFFLGGREDVLPPRLQCASAGGESGFVRLLNACSAMPPEARMSLCGCC